ncbi:MAG TPA: hypothetical protein VG147_05090 [Solirubrobacteraceae bacterium]|nr:hypothetical protein [Solirubrobacteraceae bacterium]
MTIPPQPGGNDGTAAKPPAYAQPAPTLAEHEAARRKLENRKAENLLAYGKVYAYGAMGAMAVQIVIADIAFYWYGYEHVESGHHWQIPAGAIQVWLGATVVQVIGIVLVIARSLFPSDTKSDQGG